MMFDSFSFGHISYNGEDYDYDLLVDTKGTCRERGPRPENHLLEAKELANYLEPETKKLIVGRGSSGILKIADDAIELLKSKNIELVEALSAEAIQLYNSEPDKSKVTALIHSTC